MAVALVSVKELGWPLLFISEGFTASTGAPRVVRMVTGLEQHRKYISVSSYVHSINSGIVGGLGVAAALCAACCEAGEAVALDCRNAAAAPQIPDDEVGQTRCRLNLPLLHQLLGLSPQPSLCQNLESC